MDESMSLNLTPGCQTGAGGTMSIIKAVSTQLVSVKVTLIVSRTLIPFAYPSVKRFPYLC